MTPDFFAASFCGQPSTPLDAALRWNPDPWLLAVLGTAAVLMLRRRDHGRLAGIGVLAVLFVSPLCALANALFSARTVHHLLLMLVAAPLLAAAWRAPGPGPARGAGLALAFGLSTAALWAWHVPAWYALAVQQAPVYLVMQATLLFGAWAYWRAIMHAPPGVALVGIVAGAVQMGLLGALLTFAQRPLYAPHAAHVEAWGLSPLADQQLAGLLMWVPAMLPYAVMGWRVMTRAWGRAGAAPAATAA